MAALSRSVEHAASMSAFRRHFRELAQVIEHQLSSFNAIVYADFLIGEETKVKADPDATLNQIEDCLRNDANVYKRFIEALSMTSSTASVAKVIEDLEKTRAWYLTNASTTKPSQTENEACAFVEAPLEQVPSDQDSTVDFVTGTPTAVAVTCTNTTGLTTKDPRRASAPVGPVQVQEKSATDLVEVYRRSSEPIPNRHHDNIHRYVHDAVDSLNRGLCSSVIQNQDLVRQVADQERIITHTTNQLRAEKQINAQLKAEKQINDQLRKAKEAKVAELTEKLKQMTVEAKLAKADVANLLKENVKLKEEKLD